MAETAATGVWLDRSVGCVGAFTPQPLHVVERLLGTHLAIQLAHGGCGLRVVGAQRGRRERAISDAPAQADEGVPVTGGLVACLR